MVYRLLCLAVMSLLILATVTTSLHCEEREELAKIIKTIPPNGPFWQYGNIVMRRKSRKAGMKPVIFSHWSHRARYTCRVCHQELGFSMRAGDTGITRAQYQSGKFCGTCHDGTIAFSARTNDPESCARCHMKDTAPLQEQFEEFADAMPMSAFGNGIDWARALRNGRISPKDNVRSSRESMQFPDSLKNPIRLGTTSPRSDVTFSHEEHFAEMDCSSCHPDIFRIKRKGTEAFTMERNIFGNFCGVCHMGVAFPMTDCKRCHPQMSNF